MAAADKTRRRTELGAARRARPVEARDSTRAAIRDQVLARVATEDWDCVAAYEPLPTEPGSIELLVELHEQGLRVLVPRTLADRDLDWVHWAPPGARSSGPLGVDAIGAAQLVLVPALAVARDGTRLGRGGGSYDRALTRCRPGAVLAALIFEDELVPALPRDRWDVPVGHAVTPTGWVRLERNTGDTHPR